MMPDLRTVTKPICIAIDKKMTLTKWTNHWTPYSCIRAILAIAGLSLQVVAFFSDSWVLLKLMFVPMCGGRIHADYQHRCWGTVLDPHEVARAGLWRVCHTFPFGYVPKYYYTEPYCSNFSDDDRPAEFLAISQGLCRTAILLSITGIIISGLASLTNDKDLRWTGSVVCVLSGLSGLLGAREFYMNMSKEFLVPFKLNQITMSGFWAFHSFVDGSVLIIMTGFLDKHKRPRRVVIV